MFSQIFSITHEFASPHFFFFVTLKTKGINTLLFFNYHAMLGFFTPT